MKFIRTSTLCLRGKRKHAYCLLCQRLISGRSQLLIIVTLFDLARCHKQRDIWEVKGLTPTLYEEFYLMTLPEVKMF